MRIHSKDGITDARLAVQRTIDKLNGWADKWEAEGDALRAKHTRFCTWIMERNMLGSAEGGCVIAAFDLRYLDDGFRTLMESIDFDRDATTPGDTT